MANNELVCTICDSEVILGLDYDGYFGECECTKQHITPQTDSEYIWSTIEELSTPDNFSVDSNIFRDDTPEFTCAWCGESDSVSLAFANVDLYGRTVRVEFTCSNDHKRDGRDNTSVAYKDPVNDWMCTDFIPDEYLSDAALERRKSLLSS